MPTRLMFACGLLLFALAGCGQSVDAPGGSPKTDDGLAMISDSAADLEETQSGRSGAGETAAPAVPRLIPREILFGNPDKAAARISPDGKHLSYLAPVK